MAFVFALILLLFSAVSHAAPQCTIYQAQNGYGSRVGTGTSPGAAVSDWLSKAAADNPSISCSSNRTGYSRGFSVDPDSVTTTTFVIKVTTAYVDWSVTGTNEYGYSTYGCVSRAPDIAYSTGLIGANYGDCPVESVCDEFAGDPTGMGPMDFSIGTTTASGMASRMGTTGYGCFGGCTVKGTVTGGGVFGGSGIVTLTGTSFTGGPACTEESPGAGTDPVGSTTTTFAPPSPCGKGKCPGQVNGATVCVPCDINSQFDSTQVRSTSTTSDGTSTESTTKTNSSTTVTTCDKTTGLCTTSTSSGGTSDGTPNSSVTDTTSTISDFCKDNPRHKSCANAEEEKEQGSFSGTCQSNFTCDGDAVTCATAQAVNTQLCNFSATFSVSPQVISDYALIASGSKILNPKDNPTNRNLGTFDQTNPFSATCPMDQSFSVGGSSFVIPLGSMCGTLQMLGNAMVAFTLLAATLFVLKGAAT